VIIKLPDSKNERDFLKFVELIEDGDHILDIGANIGVMTYYFSKKLPRSVIHAFEPIPENLDTLLRVKQHFKLYNVNTYAFALGNENGKVNMIMPESNKVFFHGLSHVEKENSENKGNTYSVEINRLDDLDEFKDARINAIKIDVEEHEYQVLCGAKNLIQKNRPMIYCELWDSENRTQSLKLISKLNYKVFVNQEKSLKLFNDQKGFQNFFFIPAERCDNLKL
jgi:FkbM family methyltransferase